MKDKIIRLRKGRLGRLKPGHPWIYRIQLLKAQRGVTPGEIASIIDSKGQFIGRGYYNPSSEIAVRLLTFDDEPIDGEFFGKKIRQALDKRKKLLAATDAIRAVYSESDSLPGLIVDLYSDTAVFQVFTLGIEKLKEAVVDSIRQILNPKYIYEKSDSPFRKLEGLKTMTRWWGEKKEDEIKIREGRALFLVDVERGHKTGFYLDQRKSRMALEGISKGKRVLDLFCYTGGFSTAAAVFGAREVIGVDIKNDWLDLARKNAFLNGVSDRARFMKDDAFTALRKFHDAQERFDIIVIDPPSFAKHRGALKDALRGYKELNLTAMKTLSEGGVLATFSCSHHVPNEAFAKMIERASSDAKKSCAILKRCHQAEDHPITRSIPETEYLKGYFLKAHSP